MTKAEVIELIKKMIELNQREQAARTYTLANRTWPEWCLRESFEQMKEAK